MRTAAQLPEPGRFWIRHAPRRWPEPPGPWSNLAAGRLDWGRSAADPGGEPPVTRALDSGPEPLDDLLYLPPVPAERATERERLAGERLAAGTPVLVQLAPGETPELPGAVLVYDLLPALLGRDLAPLALLPAGAAAVWPLLPGLSDDPGLWRAGCQVLADQQVACVQAWTPGLDPADRRLLVELCGEELFAPLFHRDEGEPSERPFARAAHRLGLAPFLARPLPRPPIRGIANRRIAGALALAGELWLRLGRPVGQGEALYAAARQVDRTPYDLTALAREGNLGVLGWLSGLAREVVEEEIAAGGAALLAALLAEYVAEET
jgi:hypothetical protein